MRREIDSPLSIGVKIITQKGMVAEIRATNTEQFLRAVRMAKTYPGSRIDYSVKKTVGEERVSQDFGKGPEGLDRALEVLGE